MLLTDVNLLLIVEKGIRDRTCYAIHRYAKAKNKYMKDYDPSKESLFLMYWKVNLYGWEMCLKKTKVELVLLTDVNMLLMVEKGIRDRMCYAIHKYAKAITNTWKTMIQVQNHHFLCTGMPTIFMDGQCHKSL